MDKTVVARLCAEVTAPLDPVTATLVRQRIKPEQLMDLMGEAVVNVARRRSPNETLSEGTISELRRLVLVALGTPLIPL